MAKFSAPSHRPASRTPRPPEATTEGTRERSATAMQPFDREPPSATSNVDEVGPDGRPQARQGLTPQDNERPHPTAAARPGKSSGMAGFVGEDNTDDPDDADTEVDAKTRDLIRARRDRDTPIKVEATQLGYYDNHRRRPGEVFFIYHESEFSRKWMRRVGGSARISKPSTAQQALNKRHDEILGGRVADNRGDRGVDEPEVDGNPLRA